MGGDETRLSEMSEGLPRAHVGHPDVQWVNAYPASLAAGPSRSTTASALRVVAKDFLGASLTKCLGRRYEPLRSGGCGQS